MKITSLIFSAALALIALGTQAQTPAVTVTTPAGITYGVRAGVNMQNINGKDAANNTVKNTLIIGFNAGVNAEIPIATDFYLQPGILYSIKGAKLQNNSGKVSIAYLEVPINFLYKPLLGTNRLLLGFGPYVGYGIGGKYKPATGGDMKIKFKNTVQVTDPANFYVKHFDAGANFLAGYELSSRISLQLNAQLGLLKINPTYKGIPSDKSALKNTGFGISAGYRF